MAMPRPTAAQFAYGTCTVIFSTLAMLLLSQTSSGPGVAVVAVAALALGLLVAMTVPQPRARKVTAVPAHRPAADREPVPAARVSAGAGETARGRAA
ncbi:putative membrane protein [Streptomyces ambofaciens ATCC 23877]|nr:putative membrane protein [Streptomyces ambofaciens ATCC 23877]